MRTALVIIAMFSVVNGASVSSTSLVDLSDSEAILSFATAKTQNSPAILDISQKAFQKSLEDWSINDQKYILKTAGLSGEKIEMVTKKLFTAVQWKKKTNKRKSCKPDDSS